MDKKIICLSKKNVKKNVNINDILAIKSFIKSIEFVNDEDVNNSIIVLNKKLEKFQSFYNIDIDNKYMSFSVNIKDVYFNNKYNEFVEMIYNDFCNISVHEFVNDDNKLNENINKLGQIYNYTKGIYFYIVDFHNNNNSILISLDNFIRNLSDNNKGYYYLNSFTYK